MIRLRVRPINYAVFRLFLSLRQRFRSENRVLWTDCWRNLRSVGIPSTMSAQFLVLNPIFTRGIIAKHTSRVNFSNIWKTSLDKCFAGCVKKVVEVSKSIVVVNHQEPPETRLVPNYFFLSFSLGSNFINVVMWKFELSAFERAGLLKSWTIIYTQRKRRFIVDEKLLGHY